MRYISLFTHEGPSAPPTQEEMTTMGKLVEEGMKAGWLIVTEGVHFGSQGTRVQAKEGEPLGRSTDPLQSPRRLSAAMPS